MFGKWALLRRPPRHFRCPAFSSLMRNKKEIFREIPETIYYSFSSTCSCSNIWGVRSVVVVLLESEQGKDRCNSGAQPWHFSTLQIALTQTFASYPDSHTPHIILTRHPSPDDLPSKQPHSSQRRTSPILHHLSTTPIFPLPSNRRNENLSTAEPQITDHRNKTLP